MMALTAGDYDLEIEKLFAEIEKARTAGDDSADDGVRVRRVLIQLPDGLKQYADEIRAAVVEKYPALEIIFWSGSCFGACDVPMHVRNLKVDLIVQFGHAPWRS